MIKNKNVILTGSEGFLGNFLRTELNLNGYNVISIDKQDKKNKNYFKTDLSKFKDLTSTLKKIKKKFKQIDFLNNLATV